MEERIKGFEVRVIYVQVYLHALKNHRHQNASKEEKKNGQAQVR